MIIQSVGGSDEALKSINGLGADVRRRLASANAMAVDITAGKLASLAKQSGLTITPDATVRLSGLANSSNELWPYATGNAWLWGTTINPAPQAPDDCGRRLGHRSRVVPTSTVVAASRLRST